MKQLSRKKIQDMIDLNGVNISSRRSSGGSGAGGGGGVSSAWVDEHYVSKDFFARLFIINGTDENDDDVVVEPNDLETTITNIQAMVGLWTEQYLSALGQGSGGGGGGGALLTEPLASINEAGMGTPSSPNQVLAWDGVHWTYKPYNTGNGTVTSIRIAVPMGFSVNPSTAITTSGTFTISFARGTLGNGMVLATPSSGTGDPIWRALVADDIPNLAASKITSGTLDAARIPDLSGTYATTGRVTTLENYFDANGNAKSALKLTTVSKTAWGRTYWTANGVPDSIDGNMSSVGNISFAASGKNIGGIAYFDTTNGRLGIDKSTPTVTLDVGGYTKTTRLYLADNVYLIYDSANGGVHLVGAGLYADTYLSALGAGSGGSSGGSGITMNDVWSAMASPAPSSAQEQIEASHLAQALSGYASKTWVQNRGYMVNGSIDTLTFSNGANNRKCTITNNGAIKLDVASVGSQNGWETGYFVTNGSSTELGAFGLFGVGTSLNYVYIGTEYDNTWMRVKSNGNVGIGNIDPAYKLHVNGTCYINGDTSINGGNMAIGYSSPDSTYKLKVSGKVRIADQVGINADAEADAQCMLNINGTAKSLGWNSYSDIRLKDVINPVTASVEDIANVRIFDFRWKKDGENGKIHFGSAAQDWQPIFPHAVVADNEGFLSMDYGGIAVGAVKTVAQEVVLLKKRVAELEKRFKAS